ncbi:macro domain-containing protein [Steroidobacter flavus]|uniref:Macro domain-containing protein n=1 Tax=Steroidobacter flavus TaxID=1842136 RepID=A0ABV8SV83_9GAMM
MDIHLCALDPTMAQAWARQFGSQPGVAIHVGNILRRKADAILSPANSFGFMDGGIDLAYSEFFGWDLQDRLQETLRREHAGELPVGNAVVIPTQHADIPYLVSAPTMRIPQDIAHTVNVYLAFRAALRAAQASSHIRSLLSPALGTGVGGMSLERAAKQMYAAYADVILEETQCRASARGILRHHAELLA